MRRLDQLQHELRVGLQIGRIIIGTLDKNLAARIRRAMAYVPIERIVVAPDCGMKYLPRDVAFGKLKAMIEGASIVRNAA
jgi:methionine synthase II (cobalamin-independent)